MAMAMHKFNDFTSSELGFYGPWPKERCLKTPTASFCLRNLCLQCFFKTFQRLLVLLSTSNIPYT